MLQNLLGHIKRLGLQKYLTNISWLLVERVIRVLVALIIDVWIARYLGPEKFGILSYAISFVGLFSAISSLGLNAIVIRDLVKFPDKKNEILGSAFWLKISGAFLMLLLLWITLWFTDTDNFTKLMIFIIASSAVFQSFNVIDFYFQSLVLSKYVVWVNSVGLFISSIIKLLLIYNHAPLIAFAWVILFDSIILAIGYVYVYIKNVNDFVIRKFKLHKETAKSLLRDGWPLVLTTIFISIYSQLDQVMIKNMVNNYEVGQYSAAAKLNSFFAFLPSVVLISLTPAIVKAKKKSMDLFLQRLQLLYDLVATYGLIVALFILIFADLIIRYSYGEAYSESATIMRIIVFSNLFSFLGAASSRWFINMGYERKILYRNLFGVTVNIISNYIFIKRFGAIGAAYTTLLSQISANLLYDLIDPVARIVFYQKIKSIFFISQIKNFKKIIRKEF